MIHFIHLFCNFYYCFLDAISISIVSWPCRSVRPSQLLKSMNIKATTEVGLLGPLGSLGVFGGLLCHWGHWGLLCH